MIDQGRLRQDDRLTATMQPEALIEANIFEPALFGVEPWCGRDKSVAGAVAVFLRQCGA